MSHSGSVVAVAIREGDEPLGVDVEAVSDAAGKLLEVAPDVLAAEERDAIDRLPHGERVAGLLRFWTRKEAVLKATGDGLRLPMRDLVISGPLDPPAMRQWVQRPELVGQIWLLDLDLPGSVATSHIAALAGLGGRPDQVRLRDARPLLRVLA